MLSEGRFERSNALYVVNMDSTIAQLMSMTITPAETYRKAARLIAADRRTMRRMGEECSLTALSQLKCAVIRKLNRLRV